MAETAKKSNKAKSAKPKTVVKASNNKESSSNYGKIICLIIGIVAIIAVIFAVVFAVKRNTLNDDFFVSDSTKLVLTLENNYQEEGATIVPTKSHLVYYYSGDKITGVKYYYEFPSNEKATEAFNELNTNDDFDDNNYALSGKYIIFTFPTSQYENLTVEEIRSYLEEFEQEQNSIQE